jgi:hypothetical protein
MTFGQENEENMKRLKNGLKFNLKSNFRFELKNGF